MNSAPHWKVTQLCEHDVSECPSPHQDFSKHPMTTSQSRRARSRRLPTGQELSFRLVLVRVLTLYLQHQIIPCFETN